MAVGEEEGDSELASPRPSQPGALGLARHAERLRGSATSPFSKITNDLESMMNEMEVDAEATLASRHRAVAPAGARSRELPAPRRPISSTLQEPPLLPPPSNENVVSRSLWIGNLDPTLGEAELRAVFEPLGLIESMRLLPSKECAFVNYYSVEDAVKARERLQGAALGNMIVRIGYGKVEGANGSGSNNFCNSNFSGNNNFSNSNSNFSNNNSSNNFSNNNFSGALPPDQFRAPLNGEQSRSVWVGHVGPDMDVDMLCDNFAQFGEIESCRILDAKNCAFVNFFSTEDAARARRAMNGARIGTSIIKTGFAKSTAAVARADVDSTPVKRAPSVEGRLQVEEDVLGVAISTQEVGPDEFRRPIPSLPAGLQLPEELNSSVIRECRRRVEHAAATPEEIDEFSKQIMRYMLVASVDPVGNILVQKLIERGSNEIRSEILAQLGRYIAAVGIHKNGTWVIQKLINNCRTAEQRAALAELLQPHIVPLLQDQFGNYVVQCCLAYGPAGNQFLFDALYHRCVDIATSRFGSRAMRSCLESPHVSVRQTKFVAMALINHALTLAQDPNGVIVLQWFLDSDLPGRHAFLAPVLRGHYAGLCLSKHASSIVAKLVHPAADAAARDLVLEELFAPGALPSLLQEPMAAAILLRCLMTARPEQKIRLAHLVEPHLTAVNSLALPHLQKLREETDAAVHLVELDVQKKPSSDGKEPLQRAIARAPTLLSHAVGGPVSNSSVVKGASSLRASANGLGHAGRQLSFGTVTVTPDTPEASPKHHGGSEDRLSFGPALLQRFDIRFNRPPTPS